MASWRSCQHISLCMAVPLLFCISTAACRPVGALPSTGEHRGQTCRPHHVQSRLAERQQLASILKQLDPKSNCDCHALYVLSFHLIIWPNEQAGRQGARVLPLEARGLPALESYQLWAHCARVVLTVLQALMTQHQTTTLLCSRKAC